MKTASQAQFQQPVFLNLDVRAHHENPLSHAWELGWDYVIEAYEVVAGIFAMPARYSNYDHGLSDHLLRDIGQERTGRQTPEM